MTNRPWERNTSTAAMIDVDETTYFAEYDGYMTAHKTADFRESPALFRAKYIDKTIVEPDRPAYAFGSAAHCLILEGDEKFDQRFIVSDGPKNPRTGECYGRTSKAFGDWLDEMRSANVEPITKAEFEQIKKCGNRSRNIATRRHCSKRASPNKPFVRNLSTYRVNRGWIGLRRWTISKRSWI